MSSVGRVPASRPGPGDVQAAQGGQEVRAQRGVRALTTLQRHERLRDASDTRSSASPSLVSERGEAAGGVDVAGVQLAVRLEVARPARRR